MTTTETMKTEAYAKVNLTLEVFGVRGDGYHALRSIVVPVSLSDTLEIEPSDGLSSDTGYPDDLILKAACAIDPSRGARFRVTKRIPAGGGLGGGSADAAAALVVLNEMWGLGRTREELAEIGAKVGSDVPALVLGGSVALVGGYERPKRKVYALDAGLVHLRGDVFQGKPPAPAADSHPLGGDGDGGQRTTSGRKKQYGGRQET